MKQTQNTKQTEYVFPINLVNPHWLDFAIQKFRPTWSGNRIHAEILDKISETKDVVSLILAPNHNWNGFVPGQYVLLKIRIDGVIHERCYSLSGTTDGPLRLTIKRVPGGQVSSYIHDHLEVGDVVELSPAQGDFVPQAAGEMPILMIAGGIGITPLMSMLTTIRHKQEDADIALVYYGRSERGFAFEKSLRHIAADSGVQVHFMDRSMPTAKAALNYRSIKKIVSDIDRRFCYCCGPQQLMDAAENVYRKLGLPDNIKTEQFMPVLKRVDGDNPEQDQHVHLLRSGQSISGDGDTLLELAENHGVPVKSGCRMGICNTCRCTKLRGTVLDLKSGELLDQPNTEIRLCTTRAVGQIELDL